MTRGRRIAPGLYRLPGNRYLVRVSSGPREARVTIQRQFPSKQDAEDFLHAFRLRRTYQGAGLETPDLPAVTRTLRQLWDGYIQELHDLGRSAAHQRNAGDAKKLSEAALGPDAKVPLKREDLVAVAKYSREHTRSQGYAVAHCYQYLTAAHKRAGLTMAEPPAVHVIRRGRRVLSPEDWKRFLDALPEGSCERVAVLVGYVTGCRESELYALRRWDVDLKTGTVTVVSRKTGGVPRLAYLGPRVLAVVRAWRPGDPPDAPLLSLDGRTPLETFSLRAALRAASKRAGISPLVTGLGWVRNQAATAAVERGEGIDVASRALGHTQISTTRKHYDHAVMTAARQAFSASQEEAIWGQAEGLVDGPPEGPHQYHTEGQGSPKGPQPGRNKRGF